jgi:hypothetical protein
MARVTRLLGGLLCAVLASLPVVPPEHVHEARDEDGRIHLVVHRHLEAHSSRHHAKRGASSIDDIDPIITLTPAYTVPPGPPVLGPQPLRSGELLEPRRASVLRHQLHDVEQLIHGPPRAPTPLRGPPVASLS